MAQIMEKTFFAGIGALSLAVEKAKKVVDDLVKKGEARRDDVRELVQKWEDRGRSERESLCAAVGQKCPDQLRFATRQDIERLEQKLDELREKLN